MTRPSPVVLQCPTRLDGDTPLIAHAIPPGVCRSRQAAHYHKCPSCALAAGAEARAVQPPSKVVEPVQKRPKPAPPPVPARIA